MNRPLLSFVVLGYRQERFIRETVESALNQTYSPLEVILSDDCSPDCTFAIMQEMAERYGGPHRVILNRTERNVGLGEHVNQAMHLAQGSLVVVSAGDDLSLPQRTERLWTAWEDSERTVCSLYSAMEVIDDRSRRLGWYDVPLPSYMNDFPRMCREFMPGVMGASHAWDRRIFDIFGPLHADVVFEDRALAFRSLLQGGIAHLEEPLVRYRRLEGCLTWEAGEDETPQRVRCQVAKHARNRMAVYRQWLDDLGHAPHPPPGSAPLIDRLLAEAEFEWAMQQDRASLRWRAIGPALRAGVRWTWLSKLLIKCGSRTLHDAWLRWRRNEAVNAWRLIVQAGPGRAHTVKSPPGFTPWIESESLVATPTPATTEPKTAKDR